MTHSWRPMQTSDIAAVTAISDAVHGIYTEPAAVYTERLTLHPAGCFVLDVDGEISGFLITHPWHGGKSPALGEMLGAIPDDASTYYLHDIALLPQARGTGAGREGLKLTIAAARSGGFREVSLVAVNGADRYWAAQGFAYDHDAAPPYGNGTFRMMLNIGA